MRLFIDDERYAPASYTHTARTVREATRLLEAAKATKETLELVSFDYDAHSYKSWTFEAVADWIRKYDFWPDEIRIHTLNSWTGRPYFERFFKQYAPQTTHIDLTDPHDLDSILKGTAPPWVLEFQKAQMR